MVCEAVEVAAAVDVAVVVCAAFEVIVAVDVAVVVCEAVEVIAAVDVAVVVISISLVICATKNTITKITFMFKFVLLYNVILPFGNFAVLLSFILFLIFLQVKTSVNILVCCCVDEITIFICIISNNYNIKSVATKVIHFS